MLALLPTTAILLWSELEGPGLIGQALRGRGSQSVIGVRAAVGNTRVSPLRVVLLAPLDHASRFPPRPLLVLCFVALAAEFALIMASLATPGVFGWALAGGAALLGVIAAIFLLLPWFQGPEPAVLGAGELSVLVAVAEELGELRHVELWTVALGAVSSGEAGLRHLLERYPFGADTYFINLHHMTAGQPIYVTREGLLRERRSDRRLLALAGVSDAADVTINAEPRRLRRRTLAALLLRRGFRGITVTSYSDVRGFTRIDPRTLERCVKLVVGMIRELDQEESVTSDA
jgi:hypothetical protein